MDEDSLSRRQVIKGIGVGGLALLAATLLSRRGIKSDTNPFGDLTVEAFERSAVELSLREDKVPINPNKKAVLVKEDNSREDDVYIMDHLLRCYGYQCDTIEPEDATEERIFGKLEQLAAESNEDHQMVFYHSGHGIQLGYPSGGGITVYGSDINSRIITPLELLEPLGRFKGKKAIILDSCHSGGFVDFLKDIDFQEMALGYNIIDNYVAIAACPVNSTSFTWPHFINGRNVGALTFGLYQLLNFAKGPVDLSTADIKLGNKPFRENIGAIAKAVEDPSLSLDMQRAYDTHFIL